MVYEEINEASGAVRRQKVDARPVAGGIDFVVTGLEIGTRVVAAGAALLVDGQVVRPFLGFDE